MIMPGINLNGTSADALCDQANDVVRAADALLQAMVNAAPHGRDYQHSKASWDMARYDYNTRATAIRHLRSEYEQLAIYASERIK